MSVLDFFKKAKQRVVEEIDLMLTEAERNTPNLHEFQERNYIEHEVHPKDLRRGDRVTAIEFFAHDATEDDLIGRQFFEGFVESVDVKREVARIRLADQAVSDNVPFHLVRFFKTPA